MGRTREICGVCEKWGTYDHDEEENGDMTLLCHYFDYIHWDCFDEAMKIRESQDREV